MPFPNIDPVLLQLGPVAIRWYALAYIAGILTGWWYLSKLMQTPQLWNPIGAATAVRQPPLTKTQLDDVLFWVTVGIILGGRIGFVLFYRPELLVAPIDDWPRLLGAIPFPKALAVWQGGMSFHGGLLGVGVATLFFARKYKLEPLAVGDLFACAAPIGLFFGRVANFINAELYGRPWDGPWAIRFPSEYSPERHEWIYRNEFGTVVPVGEVVARHPSQLYEALLEGLILFVIIRFAVTKFRILQYKGAAIGLFLAGYGLSRFVVEFFREPDDYKFASPLFEWLTRGMMLSLPMIALGVFIFWHARNRSTVSA